MAYLKKKFIKPFCSHVEFSWCSYQHMSLQDVQGVHYKEHAYTVRCTLRGH
jgi:transcription elongation factor Elf1